MADNVDVLIVGAGLSGIGAAVHLRQRCPGKTFALLEARDRIGGTWDLFRYPGIRSDSDMFTLGYAFKPWRGAKAIADGPSILAYLEETAQEYGIDRVIRIQTRMTRASWLSETARWAVEVERGPGRERQSLTCRFLLMCSGYYRYEAGYTPELAGIDSFKGRIVHPQHWTDDIAYSGKRVVVIGSGATAVTLIPELAKAANHVTMLQRSPTYMVAWPDEDTIANRLRGLLGERAAYAITRWKNVLRGMYYYRFARRRPEQVKQRLVDLVRAQLPEGYDVGKHFTPHYKPWDQRVCLVPHGDLFTAIREGRASVVTDAIDEFTEHGIRLKSGEELAADLVVMATGLELQQMGGAVIEIDGRPVDMASRMAYRGALFNGLPNFAAVFGYTNASWTLKADLVSDYVCRLINHMDRGGFTHCVPADPTVDVEPRPWVDFTSGYFQRAFHRLPKQGSKRPWRLYQNYALDLITLRYGRLEDGVLHFKRAPTTAATTMATDRQQAA